MLNSPIATFTFYDRRFAELTQGESEQKLRFRNALCLPFMMVRIKEGSTQELLSDGDRFENEAVGELCKKLRPVSTGLQAAQLVVVKAIPTASDLETKWKEQELGVHFKGVYKMTFCRPCDRSQDVDFFGFQIVQTQKGERLLHVTLFQCTLNPDHPNSAISFCTASKTGKESRLDILERNIMNALRTGNIGGKTTWGASQLKYFFVWVTPSLSKILPGRHGEKYTTAPEITCWTLLEKNNSNKRVLKAHLYLPTRLEPTEDEKRAFGNRCFQILHVEFKEKHRHS